MTINLQALEAPITRILTAPNVDLSTISAKRVRKVLREDPEYAFLGLTTEMLKVNREAVDGVIARIFESVSREAREGGGQSEGDSKRKREDDEGEGGGEGEGEVEVEPSEPSEDADAEEVDNVKVRVLKKKKGKKTVEESDAELARKLSSEINSRSRRGSANVATSSPRKAKRKPKKSAETVDSEEDEDGETKPKKRSTAKGGFAKEYLLSEPLSAVLGVEKLSRPQVVKKLWEYIRAHELQNPSNKREIICDGGLRPVFAVDKIDMFRMNKVLGQHLHEE